METVAEASETKAQAEGEATTEDRLAPKEVQEAVKERKGERPEGGKQPRADAEGETDSGIATSDPGSDAAPPLDPALPKGAEPTHRLHRPTRRSLRRSRHKR